MWLIIEIALGILLARVLFEIIVEVSLEKVVCAISFIVIVGWMALSLIVGLSP